MGLAAGAWRRLGAGFQERAMCFWGIHAVGFNVVVFLGVIGLGAIIGALIGLFVGILTPDPEPLTHLALAGVFAMIGVKIGAIIGGLLSVALIVASKCNPCGFCFCVIAFLSPWGWPPFPIPVFIRPCTSNCAPPPVGLVPPGCP